MTNWNSVSIRNIWGFSNISVKRIIKEEYIKIMEEHGFRY